jgi:hypothetical protein
MPGDTYLAWVSFQRTSKEDVDDGKINVRETKLDARNRLPDLVYVIFGDT